MSNTRLIFFLILIIIGFHSCINTGVDSIDIPLRTAIANSSPNSNIDYYVFPSDNDYNNFAPNTDLPYTLDKKKVELGKMLFFETALGAFPVIDQPECYETYSCASCHLPEFGFTPGSAQAIADGGVGYGQYRYKNNDYADNQPDAQGARPLSLINVSYVKNTLWAGVSGGEGLNTGTESLWDDHTTNNYTELTELNHLGYPGIETQNIENINIHRFKFDEEFLTNNGYQEYFDEAFGENYVEENLELAFSFAISAYLRSIYAQDAPFQKYLKDETTDAITLDQKKGALLFFGKAGCAKCHNAPNLGGYSFHSIGTKDLYQEHPTSIRTSADDFRNMGRAGFTGESSQMNAFKVPQLYNTADYATYFHGSSKYSLDEVLNYKLSAVSENDNVSQLSPSFTPVSLTAEEKANLLDFLENGLYDPNLATKHTPAFILSGNCYPNNDQFSISLQGCN
jgi:cytochrome c peroxidase